MPQTETRLPYMAYLDGLRALAVLAVLGSHLKVPGLEGGFVGVDVFFVLSGFLITKLLVSEFERTKRIDLAYFIARRVRRLAPALLAVLVSSLLCGALLYGDERFAELVDSTVTAAFSVSNIFFWLKVGYFDSVASSKPLLHTWSLGVEEQYYVLWPVLVWSSLKLRGVLGLRIVLVVFSLVSFLFVSLTFETELWTGITLEGHWSAQFRESSATAFYLLPSRIYEFAAGGLLATVSKTKAQRSVVGEVLSLTGLAAIVLSFFALSSASEVPYWPVVPTVVGTMLAIHWAPSSSLTQRVLGSGPAIWIGKVSYAVYLVHWPLIVYAGELRGESFSYVDRAVLFGASLGLGFLLHTLIEAPIRNSSFWRDPERGRHRRWAYWSLFGAPLLLALLAVELAKLDRVPPERKTVSNSKWRSIRAKLYCQEPIPGYPVELFDCQKHRGAADTIIVWGDSHGLHLAAGLAEAFPKTNLAISYVTRCVPHSGFDGYVQDFARAGDQARCVERNRKLLEWAEHASPHVFILSSAKRGNPERMSRIANNVVERLRTLGHAAFVLEDFFRPGTELAQCRAVPDFWLSDAHVSKRCRPNEPMVGKEMKYSSVYRRGIEHYIRVEDIQCPGGLCEYLDDDGRVTYRDDHHLSALGSIYWFSRLGPRFKEVAPELFRLGYENLPSRDEICSRYPFACAGGLE